MQYGVPDSEGQQGASTGGKTWLLRFAASVTRTAIQQRLPPAGSIVRSSVNLASARRAEVRYLAAREAAGEAIHRIQLWGVLGPGSVVLTLDTVADGRHAMTGEAVPIDQQRQAALDPERQRALDDPWTFDRSQEQPKVAAEEAGARGHGRRLRVKAAPSELTPGLGGARVRVRPGSSDRRDSSMKAVPGKCRATPFPVRATPACAASADPPRN